MMVRLLADDLTGALDSAARFVALAGVMPVRWDDSPARDGHSGGRDSGTRDLPWPAARDRLAGLVPFLDAGDIAFKKVDSLLRGNSLREIALCARATARKVVVAPAFPAEGRVTRGGRQFVLADDAAPAPAGENIVAALQREGVDVRRVEAGAPSGAPVDVCDADSDADLAAIRAAYADQAVLWCGSAGLAGALGRVTSVAPALPTPRLLIVGSRHAVSRGQVARVTASHPGLVARWSVADSPEGTAADLRRRVAAGRPVLLAMPDEDAGPAFTVALDALFAAVAAEVPPPGTLVVAGGDTLVRLCRAVGAEALHVLGELRPGLPVSRIGGGAWDGVTLVSKSGAFGRPELLADLAGAPDRSAT